MNPSAELAPAVAAVEAGAWRARAEAVVDLLADGIEDNASLGFLLPVDRERIRRDWLVPVAASLAAGRHLGWWAEDDRGLCGMVLLEAVAKQNAPHRAQVQKLVVHRRCRRRGLGAALMAVVEAEALRRGRFLLELDTDDTAASVAFYRRLGWQDVGAIPDYSFSPEGALKGTRVFYKDLRQVAS